MYDKKFVNKEANMPMQITGELNQVGEEIFSLRQTAGILNVEQSRLYTALAKLPLPKQRLGKNCKTVLAVPHSLILKLLDCVDTKEYRNGNSFKKVSLLRECAENNLSPKSSQKDESIEKIKELAHRLIKMIG